MTDPTVDTVAELADLIRGAVYPGDHRTVHEAADDIATYLTGKGVHLTDENDSTSPLP